MNNLISHFLQKLVQSSTDYEVVLSLREKSSLPAKPTNASMPSADSHLLMQFALQGYTKQLAEDYPELAEQIIHSVITTSKILILFCTEEGARCCSKNSDAIHESARLQLGTNYLYMVEIDGKEPLTKEEVAKFVCEVMDEYPVEEEEEYTSSENNELYSMTVGEQQILQLIEEEQDEPYIEDYSHSLTQLYEIARNKQLAYDQPLPRHLCQQILDFLWEEEKKQIFSLDKE